MTRATRWSGDDPSTRRADGSGRVPLPSPASQSFPRGKVRELAGHVALSCVRWLGLSNCTVYLYDRDRVSLVEVAHEGPGKPPHRDRIPLEAGTPLADLELRPGQRGGRVSLPLWDGQRLLGVIHGTLPPRRAPGEATLASARLILRGLSLALCVALAHEETSRGGEGCDTAGRVRAADFLNPYLLRHLEAVVRRSLGREPVVLALLRLGGQAARGAMPLGGTPLLEACPGSGSCRGFGFGGASNRVALVWLGISRERVRDLLAPVVRGERPLAGMLGAGRGQRFAGTRVSAAALITYPEDAADAVSLLAGAWDFLDLQTFLVSRNSERRETSKTVTGDQAAVMDSHVLAAEIDRLRKALVDAIASGSTFQDAEVRDISERLDQLIVVMQRYMGHRGAVP